MFNLPMSLLRHFGGEQGLGVTLASRRTPSLMFARVGGVQLMGKHSCISFGD